MNTKNSRRASRRSNRSSSLVNISNQPTYRVRSGEMKDVSYTLAGPFGSIGTTTLVQSLSIAQGMDTTQRIGRMVNITGVDLIGLLAGGQSNLATDDKYNFVRIAIVECNVGQSPILDLTTPLDTRTNANIGLRRVLFDQLYTLQSPGRDSTGYMPPVRKIDVRIPCSIPVLFNSTLGTGACVSTLCVVMVSDSSLAPNPGFVQGSWRLYYHDA